MNPQSLEYVLNIPPEEMTDEQVLTVIDTLRADRKRMLEQPEKAPSTRTKKVAANLDLKLDDLGL